jgi:hypothetical protein
MTIAPLSYWSGSATVCEGRLRIADAPELLATTGAMRVAPAQIESPARYSTGRTSDDRSHQRNLITAAPSDTVAEVAQNIPTSVLYHASLPVRVGTGLPPEGIRTTPRAGVLRPDRAYPATRAFRWSLQRSTR